MGVLARWEGLSWCLFDWLVQSSLGRLVDWLSGWCSPHSSAWLLDWSFYRWIDWLIGWLVGWFMEFVPITNFLFLFRHFRVRHSFLRIHSTPRSPPETLRGNFPPPPALHVLPATALSRRRFPRGGWLLLRRRCQKIRTQCLENTTGFPAFFPWTFHRVHRVSAQQFRHADDHPRICVLVRWTRNPSHHRSRLQWITRWETFTRKIQIQFNETAAKIPLIHFLCAIFGLCSWSVQWLIDWLIDWLICRLIDWAIDWLICWLIDWLIDWVIEWSIERVIDWLIDWLKVGRSPLFWEFQSLWM